MVIAPRIEHGTRALFKCKDGFQLVGPNTTECMYGNWSEAMPVCQESKAFAHPKFQLVTRRASELQFFCLASMTHQRAGRWGSCCASRAV